MQQERSTPPASREGSLRGSLFLDYRKGTSDQKCGVWGKMPIATADSSCHTYMHTPVSRRGGNVFVGDRHQLPQQQEIPSCFFWYTAVVSYIILRSTRLREKRMPSQEARIISSCTLARSALLSSSVFSLKSNVTRRRNHSDMLL